MKKLLSVILLLSMLCSAAMASAAYNSLEIYVEFNGDSHVRTGPGLSYRSIDVARKGSMRSYLFNSSVDERGVTWYYVGDGYTTGWVSSKYTRLRDSDGYTLRATAGNLVPLVFDDVVIHATPFESRYQEIATIRAADAWQLEYLGLIYENPYETWYSVRYGWCEGWASHNCMELQYR